MDVRAAIVASAIALSAFSCAPGTAVQTPPSPQTLGVEIMWDTYGVPHIFASDRNGAAYAWGWAQMQNHGDLLLRLYAQARGNAAAMLGQAYLAEDRWVWTVGIPQRSGEWLAAQSPESRAHIEAYVRGINAFAAAHPVLIGDSVRAVLPVTATDVMGHVQRVLLSAFVTSKERVAAQAQPWQQRGSNAWAVGPTRTATGRAMLLANPHLPWSDLFTFMEGQIVVPGTSMHGVSVVGTPVLIIAFNDRLGWTHTVNTQDVEDLYELTLTGEDYEWDGGTRPLEREVRVLQVRDTSGALRPDTLVVRRSIHGPVVAISQGRALALRAVGLDRHQLYDQLWQMATARNLAEFEAALQPNAITTQNVMYADADGHIMFFYGGNTPRRPVAERSYWAGIIPGNTAATVWTELHSYGDFPRVLDPPSGWLQNANDPPWGVTFPQVLDPSAYPAYMAPREMSLRAQRSAALLESEPAMTLERMVALKHSTEMELANRVLPDLLAAAHARASEGTAHAARVLERWDRRADARSVGGLLFVEWWREYTTRVRGRSPFAQQWSPAASRQTPMGLADTAAAVAALEAAAESIRTRYGSLEVAWGDVFRLQRDTLDLPANGAPHVFGVFRQLDYRPAANNRFVGVSGDTYVAAIEFGATARAMSIIGYGNASRRGSPHRTDQLHLFAAQRLKPVWRTRDEVAQHTLRRERF